jgi:hypothetical protein
LIADKSMGVGPKYPATIPVGVASGADVVLLVVS